MAAGIKFDKCKKPVALAYLRKRLRKLVHLMSQSGAKFSIFWKKKPAKNIFILYY